MASNRKLISEESFDPPNEDGIFYKGTYSTGGSTPSLSSVSLSKAVEEFWGELERQQSNSCGPYVDREGELIHGTIDARALVSHVLISYDQLVAETIDRAAKTDKFSRFLERLEEIQSDMKADPVYSGSTIHAVQAVIRAAKAANEEGI